MAEGGSRIWTPGGGEPPRRPPPQAAPPDEPTPEELLEQIKRLRIADVLLSTMSTIAQLAYAKLEPETRDLEQARLAIEALRALVRVLQGAVPDELLRDFNQVVANLQLAYAGAAGTPAAEPQGEPEPGG